MKILTIGERIKLIRKDAGLTQAQFAEKLGTTQNVITNYERNSRNPSGPAINNICREFNISEDWLRTGEGDMYKPEPSSPLGDLVNVYNLDEFDQSLVMEYLKLSAEHRHVFKEYLQRVLDQTDAVDEPEDEEDLEAFIASIPDTPEELEKMYPTFDAPPDVNKMG